MTSRIDRRQFLSAGLIGLARKTDRAVAGGFVNDDAARGHQLRDRKKFDGVKRTEKVSVVIVGGGVAGLCAAWRMEKRGFRDYAVLEMEQRAGGNSRAGRNEVSAYPWGAHYLPVPNKSAGLARELCEDFGLVRDGVWEERHLCFAPQERLFLHGRWQEGIEPEVGLTARDRGEFQRFGEQMREMRGTGQFTIPMAMGARASELDRVTMTAWMREQGYRSEALAWFVDYSCRDDFGAKARDTSAWAGVHYFASREPEEKGPLTWPEGNGWLVARLLERVGERVRTGAMVHGIRAAGRGWRVSAGDAEYTAEAVIFAAPSFLAGYLFEPAPVVPKRVYSPWLTANLTVEGAPDDTAWDNVIYQSPALGYVTATHQSLRTHEERAVWTYYWALAEGTPEENRKALLERPWGYWREAILADLERAHPDIRKMVSRMDVARFGHAMARPVPGALGQIMGQSAGKVPGLYFANSDLSGFSIFEEAQYRGVMAADAAMRRVGR